MAAEISQVDPFTNGTANDYFIQVRVPIGETLEGSIAIYDSQGQDVDFDSTLTIDLENDTPYTSFDSNGFTYYTFTYNNDLFNDGGDKAHAIVLLDGSGDVQETFLFGLGVTGPVDDIDFIGGPLDGTTVGDLPPGSLIGGTLQTGLGPFAIDTSGNVTTGPSNPDGVCFLTGTLIATPGGERPVEDLAPGDEILTADGRTVPVLWIGRQTLVRPFVAMERFAPVVFAAGSLGENLPHSDLAVSVDHGMHLEGVIAHAGALLNHSTIRQPGAAELPSRLVYWHIETEAHEIVLANGVPAETFIDTVQRQAFDNYAEYAEAFGDTRAEMVEMPIPRALSARQVPVRLRSRIETRAAILRDQAGVRAVS